MKKLLSVLLAVVLCLAFSTMAFAAEETETATINTEELSSVVDEIVGAAGEGDIEGVANAIQINADKLYAAFGDILSETETVAADEAADYVITAISELTGADMENVREIVMETIEEYDIGSIEVVESSEVAGLVDEILARLESFGIDTDPIIDTLAESEVAGAIIGIYTGEPETETIPDDDEEPTEPEIPQTGDASTAAPIAIFAVSAFVVLMFAVAGIIAICAKKEAE